MRIVVFNGHSAALRDDDLAFERLISMKADVLMLVEPSTGLVQRCRIDPALEGWSMHIPETARAGWRVVLTRWPQRGGSAFDQGPREALSDGMHVMLVDRPGGSFGLVQFHPPSPRTPGRWRAGNEVVRRAAGEVRDRLVPMGIPVIAGGDLNSTPSGWRSRWFARQTGLKRAKPLLTPDGTFPSGLGRLGLAIDDVYVGGGIRVSDWRVIGGMGSDHRAVVIDLEIPATSD